VAKNRSEGKRMDNQNQNQSQNEIEFDLLQMLSYLLKRAWIIVLAMVIFAVAGYAISKKNEVPRYTASCQVFVYRMDSDGNYNDALTSLFLVKDSEAILKGNTIAKKVVANLNLPMGYQMISSGLKVSYAEDTHVLMLTFTDTNPKRAAAVLNEICKVAPDELQKHLKTVSFTVMDEAEIPLVPTRGTVTRDTILAAAIGLVLSGAALVVFFLLDDTIRSEDDVERYLGLSTLTAITLSPDLASDSKTAELARKKAPAIRVRKK
jgi:capsular polysaccharide biosynthesis protein